MERGTVATDTGCTLMHRQLHRYPKPMFSYPLVHGERFNKHTMFKLHVACYMQTHA